MSLGDLFTTMGTGAQSIISKSVSRQVYGIANTGVNTVAGIYNRSVQSGISRFVSKGSQQILDAIGIPRSSLPQLGNLGSAITLAGVNAAGQLFQGILNGTVTQHSVQAVSSYDVALAAAGNNNSTAHHILSLSDLVHLYQSQGLSDVNNVANNLINPYLNTTVKNYAADLIRYAPKYKFLYVVEFIFNNNYINTSFQNDFAFLIKQFDRPNINITHDDVNMYGYRTKVPKSIAYEPFTIQLHDDIQNKSMNFVTSYLRAVSPISNIPGGAGSTDPTSYQESSMQYDLGGKHGDTPTNNYASSLGPLIGDAIVLLQEINLYHVYDYGQFMNAYRFKNPKITQLSFDSLSMGEEDGSMITCQFAYDTVYIETGLPAYGNIPDNYDGVELDNKLEGIPTTNRQLVPDVSITNSTETPTYTSSINPVPMGSSTSVPQIPEPSSLVAGIGSQSVPNFSAIPTTTASKAAIVNNMKSVVFRNTNG